MKDLFRRFLLRISVISAVLLALSILLYFFFPAGIISPATPFMVMFFYMTTLALYYLLMKAAQNRFPRFVNRFMILTVSKLLLFLILIVVYVLLNKSDALLFVLAFFVLYIIYTVLEVSAFLKDQKELMK